MVFNAAYQIVYVAIVLCLTLRIASFVFRPVQVTIMLKVDRISMFTISYHVWKQKLYLCLHEDTDTDVCENITCSMMLPPSLKSYWDSWKSGPKYFSAILLSSRLIGVMVRCFEIEFAGCWVNCIGYFLICGLRYCWHLWFAFPSYKRDFVSASLLKMIKCYQVL